jgi:hypothetical protein
MLKINTIYIQQNPATTILVITIGPCTPYKNLAIFVTVLAFHVTWSRALARLA